jgi:hypothetical protein
MSKLTIEDLIKAQQETKQSMDAINEKLELITQARVVSTSGSATSATAWILIGGLLFLLAQTNPVGQQTYIGFCLFMLVFLRFYGESFQFALGKYFAEK